MLVNYEYEILSYIVSKSTKKSDKVLFVSFNQIKDIDLNLKKHLNVLQREGLLSLTNNNIDIFIDKWISRFADLLNREFVKCKMEVKCSYNEKTYNLDFETNGSNKSFKIIFNKESNLYENDTIFMCYSGLDLSDIFWMELLNDCNKLHMFYSYLLNEINQINTYSYRDINIFEGIEETHVSEIFNVTIKNYFRSIKKDIKETDDEIKMIIKMALCKNEINCYSVEFNEINLVLIKDEKVIKFITVKNRKIIYSKHIETILIDIKQKLSKKVSEYRRLMMFRDNKVIEHSVKLTDGATKLFFPLSIILSILSLNSMINIEKIKSYKYISYGLVVILLLVQVSIIKLLYIPSYKLSKFKWDI